MAARPAPAATAWVVGSLLALAGYALLSNWLMIHHAQAPLTVALLFGPLLLGVAAMGWRQQQWLTLAGCGVLLVVLVAVVLAGGVRDAQRLYVLQHAALHLVMAWAFIGTLKPGRTALITLLARGVHGRLGQAFTPAMADYTRRLTVAWSAYFLGMVGVSALLYWLAPWPWWSWFCTVLTPLSAGLMFLGEHALRYRLHPEFPRISPRLAFEAWQRHGREDGAA
jgi:uncharacterized membrane protein